ncbi:XAC2610-related protein [Paludibacter propionicigenes]|uniref:XAC2610-related protein n=1 Tax=Paludibacter propionicigenes TaxID=185300 RepID=UPI0011D15E86|nr:hypothetical protein [Paludibacter propionicigenes]
MTQEAVEQKSEVKIETTEILCDSVYKDKGYKITLTKFDLDNVGDETRSNSIFSLYKFVEGKYSLIYKDSIFFQFQEVKFEDFNNDKVKDILIQNYSSARSNLFYYLYTVDTKNDKLKKIDGFERIPNPTFLSKYKIIEGSAVAGKDWTKFYEIKGDSIHDFGVVIYDNHLENSNYERNYKKAINKLMKNKKTTP